MSKPLVSILIPVYERTELAIEAIDCALLQDYQNIEVIVGDNCSPGGTYDVLWKRYADDKRVILFQNEENYGAVENWKRCLEKASGRYIKFLWSDDLMSYDYISTTVELLENHCEAAFAYSSVIIFHSKDEIEKKRKREVGKKSFYHAFCDTGEYAGELFVKNTYERSYSVPVSPGCAIFRKEKLHIISDIPNKIGYNHGRNGAGPDVLMFLEALSAGESFVFWNKPSSYFREHQGSISTFDKTIMDGYYTAKQYYLRKYKINNYWQFLNSDILSNYLKKGIFNNKKNKSVLQKFYGENSENIKDYSIIGTIKWNLIRKKYEIELQKK